MKSERYTVVEQELETAREMLASLGAELAITTRTLERERRELGASRGLLAALLSAVPFSIWVVDSGLVVQLWNDRASEIWGVDSETAVGRSLLDLDIEFPVAKLEASLRSAVERAEGNRYVTADASARDGRTFSCHIAVTQLGHDPEMPWGAIVVTTEPTQSREPWT